MWHDEFERMEEERHDRRMYLWACLGSCALVTGTIILLVILGKG